VRAFPSPLPSPLSHAIRVPASRSLGRMGAFWMNLSGLGAFNSCFLSGDVWTRCVD
jgi:hypothetical protein